MRPKNIDRHVKKLAEKKAEEKSKGMRAEKHGGMVAGCFFRRDPLPETIKKGKEKGRGNQAESGYGNSLESIHL